MHDVRRLYQDRCVLLKMYVIPAAEKHYRRCIECVFGVVL